MNQRNNRVWTILLPWLDDPHDDELVHLRAVDAGDWWATRTPAMTYAIGRGAEAVRLFSVLMATHRSDVPLGSLLPFLTESREAAFNRRLPIRAKTAMRALGVMRPHQFVTRTIASLAETDGIDQNAILDILDALVIGNAGGPFGNDDADVSIRHREADVISALRTLARWNVANGAIDGPLVVPTLAGPKNAPDSVRAARDKLSRLRPMDLLAAPAVVDKVQPGKLAVGEQSDSVVVGECQKFYNDLSEKDKFVVAQRLLTIPKTPIMEVATQLNQTWDRTKKQAALQSARLRQHIRHRPALRALWDRSTRPTSTVIPINDFFAEYPELIERTTEGYSVFQFFSALPDYWQPFEEWAVRGDVESARRETIMIVGDPPAPGERRSLTSIQGPLGSIVTAEHRNLWLKTCGYMVSGDDVVNPVTSTSDHVEVILREAGHPLTFTELRSSLSVTRSRTALKHTLSSNPQFSRVDREKWGLSEWGMRPYTSVRRLIGEEVDEASGSIPLAEIVRRLTEQFDVAESTILSYVSQAPFRVVAGQVIRRSPGDGLGDKRAQRGRHTYRHLHGWRYAVTVTREHLAGSGFAVSSRFARLVGCEPGAAVTMSSDLGEYRIRWSSQQPQSSTIRRHLERLKISEGQLVFLHVGWDGAFRLVPADRRWRSSDPVERVLARIGADPAAAQSEDGAARAIAAAIELPINADRGAIVAELGRRAGRAIANDLAQRWGVSS